MLVEVVLGKRARGRERRVKRTDVFEPRPFAGLATETEWVALRELVPSATAEVTLRDPEHADRLVQIATVLPMAYPALVKADGRIVLAVQANGRSGDLSRDLAATLVAALSADPGGYVALTGVSEPGPRLQDLLAHGGGLDSTVHDSFAFWLDGEKPDNPEVAASLERANASILPTVRLRSAESAYWCQVPDKAHVRWVLPDAEDVALDALARLRSAGALTLGEGTRYAGAFRAHGLLVPVFDLPAQVDPTSWEQQLSVLAKSYFEAVADTTALSSDQRQARSVIQARQLTLR